MTRMIPVYIAIAAMLIILLIMMSSKTKNWHKMTQREKKVRVILVITGFFFMISGLIAFMYLRDDIPY